MINKRKHKILNHPFVGICILVLLGFIFVQNSMYVVLFIMQVFRLHKYKILINVFHSLLTILYSLVALWIYHLWFQGECKSLFSLDHVNKGMCYLFFPVFIVCGLNSLSITRLGNLPLALVYGLAPGISEEIIFRAIPLSNAMRNIKKDYHIILYVIVNGLLFGVIHITNLFMGAGFGATLSQVIYATGIGILFGAIFIRTGSIIPCIIAHSLIDISALIDPSLQESVGVLQESTFNIAMLISSLMLFMIPTVIAFFSIRKSKWPEIKEIWKEKWNLSI